VPFAQHRAVQRIQEHEGANRGGISM